MSDLPKATKHRELVQRFKALGWTGPHVGTGKHPLEMHKGTDVAPIPNKHREDIREGLLKQVLEAAGISHKEWLGSKGKQGK